MFDRKPGILEQLGILTVGPNETAVVFRMGTTDGDRVRGPGRHVIVPIIDRAVLVDRSEQRLVIPAIDVTDADGRGHTLAVDVRWQVVDPLARVMNIVDAEGGVRARASIEAANGAAKLPSLGFDAARPTLAEEVLVKVAEVAGRWGIRITAVEITG